MTKMSDRPDLINALLARPPLLADEDPAAFNELFELFCEDECPQSSQEWVFVFDITCANWEMIRLSGLKVRVLHAALLGTVVEDLGTGYAVELDLTKPKPAWLAQFRRHMVGVLDGDVAAKKWMAKFLAPDGLTLESILASAFARKISVEVSADRLMEAACRRRNGLYADLERARSRAKRFESPLPAAASPPLAVGDERPGSGSEEREDIIRHGAVECPNIGKDGLP